jgi:predicted DNA-binding transcriptional regulator AlpA
MEQTRSDLLTEAETSHYLAGVAGRTLRQWRYTGDGPPFVRVGRAIRYRRADLDTWIAQNRVTPGASAS